MFNNPRSRLLSSIDRSEARLFSVRNRSPMLPHLYVSPSKKEPRQYILEHQQPLIQRELEQKIFVENGRGPGLAVNSTKGFQQTMKPILCSSALYNQTREVMAQLLPQLDFHQNSLIVLEGSATKRLFVYLSHMKKMVYSICCSEKISAVIDRRSLRLRCEGCGSILLYTISRKALNRADTFSEIDKLRASNLVNSGRYCRTNIMDSIRQSHQHHREIKHQNTDPSIVQHRSRRNKRVVDPLDNNNRSVI